MHYYLYFFKINLKFQSKVRDDCHDMTQKSVSFNDFAVPTVRRNDYRINFWFTTENKVLYRGKNTDLNEKTGDYEKNKYLFQ